MTIMLAMIQDFEPVMTCTYLSALRSPHAFDYSYIRAISHASLHPSMVCSGRISYFPLVPLTFAFAEGFVSFWFTYAQLGVLIFGGKMPVAGINHELDISTSAKATFTS